MGRPRKIRSDTVAGAQEAFAAVLDRPSPPQRLGKKAMVYFDAIYDRRAAEEWNSLDLLKACTLARLYVERDVDARKYRADGGSVSDNGKMVKRNPRDVALVQRENLIMRMEKHLRLHANSDYRNVSQIRGQRQAEAAARAAIQAQQPHDDNVAGDSLLPLFTPGGRPQ